MKKSKMSFKTKKMGGSGSFKTSFIQISENNGGTIRGSDLHLKLKMSNYALGTGPNSPQMIREINIEPKTVKISSAIMFMKR